MAARTLFDALREAGITPADVARREKQRLLAAARDRAIRIFPGRVDYTVTDCPSGYHSESIGRAAKADVRRYVDHGSRLWEVARSAADAMHDRMVLDQCPDGRTRTAMYIGMYERLNHLVPCPVAFPDPQPELADDGSADGALDLTRELEVHAAVRLHLSLEAA